MTGFQTVINGRKWCFKGNRKQRTFIWNTAKQAHLPGRGVVTGNTISGNPGFWGNLVQTWMLVSPVGSLMPRTWFQGRSVPLAFLDEQLGTAAQLAHITRCWEGLQVLFCPDAHRLWTDFCRCCCLLVLGGSGPALGQKAYNSGDLPLSEPYLGGNCT